MEQAPKIIVINGTKVEYYQFGQGTPLLFLHGGRVRAKTFSPLLLLLAERYAVIAPDIPGFGGSDTPPAAWSFTDYAAFFDTFLAKLKLDRVTVVGYSMGGGIAANLASMSTRVRRLELIDASGIRQTEKRSYHDTRRLSFYITHPLLLGSLFVLLRDYLQYLWRHRRDWTAMQEVRRSCLTTTYDNNLRRIGVPTRLLWGRDDWIYPLSVARSFQRLIPQAELETVPGNHDWPVYDPLLIREHVL